MNGGSMTTFSRISMAAVAALVVGVSSANAADLGGNCCADLEERIAELEATTARKGTRKVSLTISGQISQELLFWDDGVKQRRLHHRPERLELALAVPRFGEDLAGSHGRLPLRDADLRQRQQRREPDQWWR